MTDDEKKKHGLAKRTFVTGAKAATTAGVAGLATDDPVTAVVSAGIAFVGGAGSELVQAGIESFKGATTRLEEAAEREKASALEAAQEELGVKLTRLHETAEDTRALVSDFRTALHAWSRAWDRTGDARKRRFLMAALLNAFDADAYEAGLTLRLFGILEELDYPEIRFLATEFETDKQGCLRRLAAERRRANEAPRQHASGVEQWTALGSEPYELIRRLMDQHLVVNHGGSERMFMHARLGWLGRRLIDLCADSEALSRAWPEPEVGGDGG